MPQLPRATDINRTVVNDQQSIAVVDDRAIGRGMQEVGATVGAIGADIKDRRTKYEMSQARAEFLTAKAKEDNAYDGDEDYASMGERYSNNLGTSLTEAASMITDPMARQMFEDEARVTFTQGQERISNFARTVERDYQRGYVSERLDSIREAGLTGSLIDAQNAANDLIDSSVGMDWLDSEEAERLKISWRNDAATAKLEMMPPEQRVDALNEDWAKFLPSDARAKILRVAEEQTLQGKAVRNVQSLDGMSPEEGWDWIQKNVTDPQEMIATESRFEVKMARDKKIVDAQQEEYHQTYFNGIRLDGGSVQDIPPDILKQMDPSIVNNMKEAERNYALDQNPKTPRLVEENLQWLYANSTPRELRRYFHEISSQLSDEDFGMWNQSSLESNDALENDPIFTGTQMIQDKVREVTMGDNDPELLSQYRRKFERYVYDFRAINGRDPTGPEQGDAINEIFLFVPTKEKIIGTEPKAFKLWDSMSPTEQGEARSYLQSIDPPAYEKAESEARANGRGMDGRYIVELFSEYSDAEDFTP